ncbi:unnamed protein product [Thelazia callipaeda]|uniref:PH domain-containing protein n=1 Tax=Thelazia callipaeda TaxID=103827 RepID=A0A0N5DAN2_THECL|nr:unnamed protein product [Thelazia callipaeda]
MADESTHIDEFSSDQISQRLYRIFTVFSDNQFHITSQQAHFIIDELFRLNGRIEQTQNFMPILGKKDVMTFRNFLHICDLLFPDRKQLEPLVDRVFERFVQQIICKGFLLYWSKSDAKKQCLIGSKNFKWRTYWCTITPGVIHLWPLHKSASNGKKKLINVDQSSIVHIGAFNEERFTWLLTTNSKQKHEFGHFDELRRKQWILAMNLAMEMKSVEELQKYDRNSSCSKEYRSLSDKNLSWRLALECENERLMQLLEDQRIALHDEEIVRTLATRFTAILR